MSQQIASGNEAKEAINKALSVGKIDRANFVFVCNTI
jgi:hypothetical protein|nr:MAG TPA: hypothetical protein [Caudoviricetes sp.]